MSNRRSALVNSVAGPAIHRSVALLLSAILLAGIPPWMSGCSGSGSAETGDPVVDARNEKLATWRRCDAVKAAWANADPVRRASVRESLKDQLWSRDTPSDVRIAIIDAFASDTDPAGLADTRRELRGLLPVESDREVVSAICRKVVAGQWSEFGPALVRSYAREVEKVPDEKRAERIALQSISNGRTPARVAFDVFLNPPDDPAEAPIKLKERTRQAAWDLLARLDPSGAQRREWLDSAPADEPVVRDMRRLLGELRVVPISGGEVGWMEWLFDPRNAAAAAWLARTQPVVASLRPDQAEGLRLRHLEPIRWASANRSAWFSAGRAELLSELESRLKGRELRDRGETKSFRHAVPSRLVNWKDRLSWADVLTILVVDGAIRSPDAGGAIFTQVDADQRDDSTEYGGVITLGDNPSSFARFVMYMPRGSERAGDRRFFAPQEMIEAGQIALAQYHFHVQTWRNSDFAGPSVEDLQFAARYGQTCVVMSGIAEGRLNVDLYQPDGVVIDLGMIERAK